ncbi:F-box/LRR-repeat protein 3-like isoform X2 [Zea mays]|uniref:F-box/LRR-repeat protein 3-like isoform X2 n=1 Tax=Zea mays TaxID=4577 RepID=UPI0004DEB051|nr:F-box/LRR-repeat protein 3-like isoform X2 [Zea mays]|eukprot:XP_008652719.1 F-box/LRR-repeat protein 3-like isoform X2 [Zea mays]
MTTLIAATKLREIVMDKCLGITYVRLTKVFVGCPGLQRLNLKWRHEIFDIGVDMLAKKCPQLRSLDISCLKTLHLLLHEETTDLLQTPSLDSQPKAGDATQPAAAAKKQGVATSQPLSVVRIYVV